MRIITHMGQAHSDEFLAVALLLIKFPDAEVHRVSAVPDEINDAIVVDIGGKFDNEKFFDHHHDPELPCSLVLILRKFFPEIDVNIQEIQWINDWDRMGPLKTQAKWNVKLPEFRDPIAEVVLRLFSKAEVIKPGDPLHTMLRMIGEEFLEFLKEQQVFIEKAKKAEILEIKGLKVVKLDENVPIRFVKAVHRDVAIVIQPNQRVQGALSLVRVDDHPRVDFRRITVPTYFVHNTGFMAIIDPQHLEQAIEQAID